MKATEQYFPVVLFIMLYKVVLTFESAVDNPPPPPSTPKQQKKKNKCDHLYETLVRTFI